MRKSWRPKTAPYSKTKSPSESKGILSKSAIRRDRMRPYLHYFLEAAYADYDIAIWSATSMKWIEAKLQELSLENSDKFKISFVLDSGAMITIDSPKYGVIEVKPLGVVWC